MIIDCAVYQDGKRRPGQLALDEAYEAGNAEDAFVWIGLYEPDEAEFESVRASSTSTSWPSRTPSSPTSGPSSRSTTTPCSWS
jgi:hypothetical protein